MFANMPGMVAVFMVLLTGSCHRPSETPATEMQAPLPALVPLETASLPPRTTGGLSDAAIARTFAGAARNLHPCIKEAGQKGEMLSGSLPLRA